MIIYILYMIIYYIYNYIYTLLFSTDYWIMDGFWIFSQHFCGVILANTYWVCLNLWLSSHFQTNTLLVIPSGNLTVCY